MKRIPAAKFLVDTGLLFEINRKVLHPLGFALEVEVSHNGVMTLSQDLQDHREEGIEFSEESVVAGEKKLAKMENHEHELEIITALTDAKRLELWKMTRPNSLTAPLPEDILVTRCKHCNIEFVQTLNVGQFYSKC